MSEFQSGPFKKTVPNTRPLREFPPIGAPSEPINSSFTDPFDSPRPLSKEEAREYERFKKEQEHQPLSPFVKQRIEFLADLGKITKEVEIKGTKFTLRTLKSRENKEVYMNTAKQATNGVEEAFVYRRFSLAYALDKIDGQGLEIMLDVKTLEDRLNLIDELEESVSYALYLAFEQLKTDANKQFLPKTEEESKQVGEELKKL